MLPCPGRCARRCWGGAAVHVHQPGVGYSWTVSQTVSLGGYAPRPYHKISIRGYIILGSSVHNNMVRARTQILPWWRCQGTQGLRATSHPGPRGPVTGLSGCRRALPLVRPRGASTWSLFSAQAHVLRAPTLQARGMPSLAPVPRTPTRARAPLTPCLSLCAPRLTPPSPTPTPPHLAGRRTAMSLISPSPTTSRPFSLARCSRQMKQ